MIKQISLLLAIIVFVSCGNNQESSDTEVREQTIGRIVGIGKVVPQGGVIELAALSSGIVEEVHVNAGDSLSKGDLIISLHSSDEELQVREADARIRSQELTVESAKIALEQERIAHTEQQRLLNDAKELLGAGASTGENVRTLQNEFDQGSEMIKKAENDLQIQQSQLNELRIQRASNANNIDKRRFRAPEDGVLLDLVPRVGEAVTLHQQYGRISPNKPLVVMVEIDELFADKVEVGQVCQVNLHGDLEVAAVGEILRVSPDLKRKSLFSDSGTGLEDRRVREAEVSLSEIYKPLFIESKVECSININ